MTVGQDRSPVVAGVDGSDAALGAVRWAAAEARRRGVPLRLVSACPWPEHPFGADAMGMFDPTLFVRVCGERLSQAADLAAEAAPTTQVQQQVITSDPVTVLVEESKRAQLVVLGDRGLGGVTGLLVGSVAVALAAHGKCPIVIVRGQPPAGSRLPVVVGVDGTPVSEAAIRFAFEQASGRGVGLVAVLAFATTALDRVFLGAPGWEAFQTWQRQLLAERLAGWNEKYPDVEVRRVVSPGAPAQRLLSETEHAQLVVVGWHGRGPLTALVLGSVSHALLHHSACPVAVVRPDTISDGDANAAYR